MTTSPELPSGNRRILVAHSEGGIRFAVADYFRYRGFPVDEAETEAVAAVLLQQGAYDAMLTDYHFSERTGEGLRLARLARVACPRTLVCLFAPPLDPDEALAASQAVDLLITRPRPLANVAQMLFALLQAPAAVSSIPIYRGS
jgi:DNA-binding response OmpR family regulator